MQVKDLKPGDQFAGVVSETDSDPFAYESITVRLAGRVLEDDAALILPPDVKMGVGQLGMFEVVRACDLCGEDSCTSVLVNLVGEDEPKWEQQ